MELLTYKSYELKKYLKLKDGYNKKKVPYNVIIYILKAIDFSHRPSSGYIAHLCSQYYKTQMCIRDSTDSVK